MYLKYENGEDYFLANVKHDSPMQERNAFKLEVDEFISNFIDDSECEGSLIIGRRVRDQSVELTEDEFCKAVNSKLEELKSKALDCKVFKVSGGLYPTTILKGMVEGLEERP